MPTTRSGISRRGLLTGAAGAALTIGLAPRLVRAADSKRLTMPQSGGSYMQAWQKTILEPFTAKYGVEVTAVSGNMSAHAVQLRANRYNPPFDIWHGYGTDFVTFIRDGMILPLTEDRVPSLKDVYPQFKEPWRGYGAYFDYGSIGLAYDTQAIKKPPVGWKEFLDRAASGEFGKTVFFPNLPSAVRGPEVMTTIARALTGDLKNVDAAFEAVKKIKPYVVKFFTSLNDPVTLLLNKEGTIGPGWDGRTFVAADESGGKVSWIRPREGAAGVVIVLGVIKGGNEAWAYKLIDFILSADVQQAFSEATSYGVVNSKVRYTGKLAERIPKPSEVIIPDEAFLLQNAGKWIDRWNREIAV